METSVLNAQAANIRGQRQQDLNDWLGAGICHIIYCDKLKNFDSLSQ